MSVQLTQREELLITADRLRQQATRLRQNAQWADSRQARENDERDARDCITRAEQMESDAAGMAVTESNQTQFAFDWIELVIRDVAELTDRTSPDYFPEAMLVTPDELRRIIQERVEQMESDAAGMAVTEANKTPFEPERPFVTFDLIAHLERQKEFSLRTFGPNYYTHRILAHIEKEMVEVRANPLGLEEWVDLILLACDGAWRAGHTPLAIVMGLHDKLAKNETRNWPDWRTVPDDQPIEHVRSYEIPAFLRKGAD